MKPIYFLLLPLLAAALSRFQRALLFRSAAPRLLVFVSHFVAMAVLTTAPAAPLHLNLRKQTETAEGSGKHHSLTTPAEWDASRTAIVICDMWEDHYCRNAARRVSEMAPRMNEVVTTARDAGALIIHCPSGGMDLYKDTPQRKLAMDAPKVETKIPLESWCYLKPDAEAPMPVNTDQPCDDEKLRERKAMSRRQIETLEIHEGDAVTDSAEAFYLMKERGITNIVIMGVHTNMCVLGRPFGIRQMVLQGMNVALVRDLTDTMYNPREEPFVSHFTGNDLVFEHIERHWCPTITSGDILGDGVAFRFPNDKRAHIAIVMAEKEYNTDETLPSFALEELGKDFKISLIYADPENRDTLPGIEAIAEADLLLVSVRRRNLPPDQLDLFREHIAAGKPLVGIRTASHAFCQNKEVDPPEGLAEWREFDNAVLGGNYHGHHSNKLTAFAQVIGKQSGHPILEGISTRRFQTFGSLYEVRPLAETATMLMAGTARGAEGSEPVAWTNTSPAGGRVFYTSLGHPYDFRLTEFRALLRNAIYWAVDAPLTTVASTCCE